MGLRAYVADNFTAMGVSISIVQQGSGWNHILRFSAEGRPQWELVEDTSVVVEPTIRLGHEEARALLEGLQLHFQDASDIRTARQDLLHERGRVDKLTDAITRIAEAKTNEATGA